MNAKVSSLQTQLQANYTEVQTLNGQIATDNALITHLQTELQANYTQVQTLTAQIVQLQTKITDLQGQIASLNTQLANDQTTIMNLQAQLASLEKANVGGTFSWRTSSCGFLTPCAIVTNVAYGNSGTVTATNAIMYARFYDSSNAFLCQVQITLGGYGAGDGSGVVPGQTVGLLFGLTDSCNYSLFSSVSYATVSFTWS